MAKNFNAFYGLCSSVLTLDGNCLVLDNPDQMADLLNQLEGDGYTRLMLSTGVGFEEFTVTSAGGKLILSPTPVTKFDKGDSVWFECCSQDNLKDIMACIEEDEDDDGSSDDDEMPCIEGYTWSAEDQCYKPDKEPLVIYDCGKKYTLQNVQYTCETLPPTQTPPDGTFNSFTIQDGKIVAATKVDPPLAGGCCGGCSKCCGDGECADNVNNAGEN